MSKRLPKQKTSRRSGKPSGSAGRGHAEPKGKASPAGDGRGRKTKRDAARSTRPPKKVPSPGPAPEPAANLNDQVVPPAPAPPDLTPEAVQQHRAGELLEDLARLAHEYRQLAFDDMELHRKASQPSLGYTAAILRGVVRAIDLGDHAWLEEQAKPAKRYVHEHRHEPHPPHAKFRAASTVWSRPEAAGHMKRFVMRQLEDVSKSGQWSYDVIQPVSANIAEIMVGSLLGQGATELAWEFLPELREDLRDDASTRARVESVVVGILERQESTGARAPKLEDVAEGIVRAVLSALGYKHTKSLFDYERKAQTTQRAERGRSPPESQVADHDPVDTQAAAETLDGFPLPRRNK
ncbi:hypothetical protein [Sorangium sp. So ce1024]|uniref:hypothetical protein n=1 Tax=Sorangium sp. So ce1024 TaxID=3133327 RepID=UPI003EFC2C61